MRVIVVGLGVQGRKRIVVAENDLVATVDPNTELANYKDVAEVPLNSYDAAIICTPDNLKRDLCEFFLSNSKHVMCEKPLLASSIADLNFLETLARQNNVFLYTAYNHRFEPSWSRAKQVFDSGLLGRLYLVRMFYGNGTSRLVQMSPWRDTSIGVIGDLVPHLLDAIHYWNFARCPRFEVAASNHFETLAPDHAVLLSQSCDPFIELEVTLCSWKNHFSCEVFGEYGSLHLTGLMKWGASSLSVNRRRFPAGIPELEDFHFPSGDVTWRLEYEAFKTSIHAGLGTDLGNDNYILSQLEDYKQQLGGENS